MSNKHIIGHDVDLYGNINVDNTDDTSDPSGGAVVIDGGVSIAKKLNVSNTITGATGSSFGNLTLANGSITDSSGAISFSNNNLTTTGIINAVSGYSAADNRTAQPADFSTGTLVLGIADGYVEADGQKIYVAKDMRVGLFKPEELNNGGGAA